MNLMGKIFTLLIFFMSICFLVIAVMVGASHRNWKVQATVNKAEADKFRIAADSAKTKTGEMDKKLAAERAARAAQLAMLESQLKISIDQYNQKETQLKEELVISQERLRRMEQAEARLAQQDAEVSDLKSSNAKLAADIADKFSLVRSLTNQRYELQNQLDALQGLNKDLSADIAVRTKVMNHIGADKNMLTRHIVPKLDGVVTKTDDTAELVAIGLGTDDGLRIGHQMDVYRGDKYIGKVTVTKTDFNVSVARIIKDFMQDNVREGDHVTSRF
jgi:small-conductance mechanosensitive channel